MLRRRMWTMVATVAAAATVAACSGSTGGDPTGADTPGASSTSTHQQATGSSETSLSGPGQTASTSGTAEDRAAYAKKLLAQPAVSFTKLVEDDPAQSSFGCPDWSKVTKDMLVYSTGRSTTEMTLRAVSKDGLPVAQCSVKVPTSKILRDPENITGNQARLGGLDPDDPTLLAITDQPPADSGDSDSEASATPPTEWGLLNLVTGEIVEPLKPGGQFSQDGLDRTTMTAVSWDNAKPIDPGTVPTPAGKKEGWTDRVKVPDVPMDLYCSVQTMQRDDHLLHSTVHFNLSQNGDNDDYTPIPAVNKEGATVQNEFWYLVTGTQFEKPGSVAQGGGEGPYVEVYVIRRDASSKRPCQVQSAVTFKFPLPDDNPSNKPAPLPLAVFDADADTPTVVLYDRNQRSPAGTADGTSWIHSRISTVPLSDTSDLAKAATVQVPDLRDSPDVEVLVQFPQAWLGK